jgi:hypothetical protein
MGIKNLHTFLRKTCPHVYDEVHLSEYAYKKIGVDTAIYLCKFKTSIGPQWLNGFIDLCMIFRTYGIHPIFLFDNVFPPEKDEEKKRRSDARKQQKTKMMELREDWNRYRASLVARNGPTETHCRMKDPNIPISLYAFLFKTFISSNSLEEDHDHRISIVDVDHEFIRIENTMLQVDPHDYDLIRELLDVMKIPYVMAIGEAEARGSYLCKLGKLDAVMTDDTDVLAYGCPTFLHKLDLSEHRCSRLVMDQVLHALDMNKNTFLDFCILCGTDYNLNIPGIGYEKSYKILKAHRGCLENVVEENQTVKNILERLDATAFPYHRVREMFLDEPDLSRMEIPWCDFPDWDAVVSFLFYHNCRSVDLNELYHSLFENGARFVFPEVKEEENTTTINDHRPLLLPPSLPRVTPSLLRPRVKSK